MANEALWQINLWAWYAFLTVWALAALRLKPVKMRDAFGPRLLQIALSSAAAFLLFSHFPAQSSMRARFMPPVYGVEILGIILSWIGAAVAVWARLQLGANWSATVTRKVGHQLISTGPYAYMRHPIYSGMLLAVLGTVLVLGEWRGWVALALVAVAFTIKAKREERFLADEFGGGYEQYRQSAGFLLPRL
jgi:protein-S-isoprenylcysteine O-methyltransferase Ste14